MNRFFSKIKSAFGFFAGITVFLVLTAGMTAVPWAAGTLRGIEALPYTTILFRCVLTAVLLILSLAMTRVGVDVAGGKAKKFLVGALIAGVFCVLTEFLAQKGVFSGNITQNGMEAANLSDIVVVIMAAHILMFLLSWWAICGRGFWAVISVDAPIYILVTLMVSFPIIDVSIFAGESIWTYVRIGGVCFLLYVLNIWEAIVAANRVLEKEDSQLVLFQDDDPWSVKKPSAYGDWGEGRKGRYIAYHSTQVLARYGYFRSGVLKPSESCDRRLFLVGTTGDAEHLRALSEQGWLIYIADVPQSELTDEVTGIGHVIAITSEDCGYDPSTRNNWIRDQIRTDRHGIEQSMAKVSSLELSDNETDCIRFLQHIKRTVLIQNDEVETFYQLLKAAEYVIHCRALLSCAADERDPKIFPEAPSFGVLDELQRDWPWGEMNDELWRVVQSLATMGGMRAPKRKSYANACGTLVYLHNCYVGHGTLAYSVTPELVHALTEVVLWLIEDFVGQGCFPTPDDRVCIENGEPLPACLIKSDRLYLLSVVSKNGSGGEYLCYETGELQVTDDKMWVFDLDRR